MLHLVCTECNMILLYAVSLYVLILVYTVSCIYFMHYVCINRYEVVYKQVIEPPLQGSSTKYIFSFTNVNHLL